MPPEEIPDHDVIDARDKLKKFCEEVDGDLARESTLSNKRYICQIDDDSSIAVASKEGLDINELTGETEVPEDWWIEADIDGDVQLKNGVMRGDALRYREGLSGKPRLSLLHGERATHFVVED